MKLHSIRNEYKYAELTEKSIKKTPFKQFEYWINEAINSKVTEPTAMAVTTLGIDGFPDSRIVLLKDYGENGFIFFTNYNSNKGKSIAKNPAISLHFFYSNCRGKLGFRDLQKKPLMKFRSSILIRGLF